MRLDRHLAATVALLAIGLARPAHAQTAEAKAGARAAGLQGLDAFDNKRYEEALDKFTRAESLMHAPTHVLMIARSQAALGHLVAAREAYTSLTRETIPPTAPPLFKEAQEDGRKELAALEPRVPTIEVKLGDPNAKNVSITMDGAEFPSALVGIAHPVDPGEHVFTAHGDDVAADDKKVKVDEGAHLTVVLDLKAAPGMKGAAAGAAGGADATPAPSSGLRIAGFAGIGLGVVGIGVGAVFAGLGFGSRGEADDAYTACGPAGCVDGTPEANNVKDLDSSANTKQTIGLIGLVAGGVLAATGVTLVVLSSKDSSAQTGLWIGPSSAGVAGRF